MKFPTLSRKFWIASTTLLVIGALFAFYILVYVEGREKKLREDKYRALARYGENMINTRRDYGKAVEKVWSQRRKIIDTLRNQNTSRPNVLNNPTGFGSRKIKKDSAFWAKNRPFLDSVTKVLVRADLNKVDFDGYLSKDQFDTLVHRHFDRIYFSYAPKRARNRTDRVGVFSIATSDFVYRPDQFDDFFIIKEFDESLHAHEKINVHAAGETFQTFQNRVDLDSIDSFMVREKGLLTSHFGEVMLADTKYKLFVHAIKFSEGESWLLCGLMETENFNDQIRAVDPLVITSAILLVLLLIVAMPILKLLIMNTYERLSIANVWFTGLSVVCGSAVLFLMIWSGSNNLQSSDNVDEQLKILSNKVKKNFQNELVSTIHQLDRFNNDYIAKIVGQLKESIKDTVNRKVRIKKDTIITDSIHVIGNLLEMSPYKRGLLQKKEESYPYFNYVMWIRENGMPEVTLTPRDKLFNYEMPKLDQRKYFSWVKKDSAWYLPKDSLRPFALQSIQSWTDHSPEAGIGIKSLSKNINAEVLAMTTRLHSVMDPALPSGYGFCIIDESGEVWFHSDTQKNHQENIFRDIQHQGKLTAAIKGRGAAFFSTAYSCNRNRMYVQPIDNIPLFLVVFHDEDYQRTPVVLTISLAFAFITILFLVQCLQMLVLFACEYESRKLKGQRFFLKVLRPDADHEARYQNAIGAHGVLLLISLGWYWWGYFATVLGFVTLPVMLMAFHQMLYQDKLRRHGIIFLILSGVIIILLNVVAFHWLNIEEVRVVIFQQLLFAFVLYLFIWKPVKLKTVRSSDNTATTQNVGQRERIPGWDEGGSLLENWKKKIARVIHILEFKLEPLMTRLLGIRKALKYPGSYYTYLMLWLILISLFPVAYFYKMAYWQESLLWAKYEQLEAREATIKRCRLLDENLPFLKDQPLLQMYPDTIGSYLPKKGGLMAYTDSSGDEFQKLLFDAWPRLPDPFGISSAASFSGALDGKWRWTKSADHVEIEYDARMGQKVHHTTLYGHFNPFAGSYGFWFILLAVLSIFMLARLICFCTKYIFGIGIIPEYQQPDKIGLNQRITQSKRVFITGLPGSEKCKVVEVDPQTHVIRCFEMGINDHAFNQKKLDYIQTRLEKHDQRIVILSAVQPSALFEVYRKWICDGRNEGDKDDTKNDNKITEYKIALRKWKNVLSEFEVYYMSVRPAPKQYHKNEIVNAELNACYYLQNLAENNNLGQGILNDEDFIMNIEEIAEPYYNALWNSFSQDEKLLLLDLAHDGFVNLKNQRTIRVLMQKGVIAVKENFLDIMNKSFTNFILSVFREDEEIEMTKKVRSKGAWQDIQLVLVLVLIAIVVFIALAQRELISNLNAFIIALTGAFGILSKFGSLFGSGAKSKE